jgi:hypothetical protein
VTVLDRYSFTFTNRRGRGRYDQCVTITEHHRIEVTTSPAGRTVHVHVDGQRWGPIDPGSNPR